MKTFGILLAGLISVLGVIAGILSGVATFAYGVYLIVLLCKGTTAVTFWAILKAVGLLCLATPVGYVVALIILALAGLIVAISK